MNFNITRTRVLLAGLILVASLEIATAKPALIRIFSEYDDRTLLLDG